MTETSVIGVGNAGRPLAFRLLDAGHDVTVYDIDEAAMDPLVAAGATAADSPADAAAPVTVTTLPGPAEVERAVTGPDGVLSGLPAEGVLVEATGSDPSTTVALAEALERAGGDLVSCTLHAGGAPDETIPAGRLKIVAGGDRPVLERTLPVLADLASRVVCVPDPTTPKIGKIGIIVQAVANHLAAVEAATWLSSQDVNPWVLHRLMVETDSTSSPEYLARVLRGGLGSGGNVRNTHKDLTLALDRAGEETLPMPLTTDAEQLLQMALAKGFEGRDLPQAVGDLYADIAGQRVADADRPREPTRKPEGTDSGDATADPETRVVWLGWDDDGAE